MKWDDLINEKVSSAHRSKVIDEASQLLRKRKPSFFSSIWFKSLAGGFGALALYLGVQRMQKPNFKEEDDTSMMLVDIELLDEMDILEELPLLEDLEVLEEWES